MRHLAITLTLLGTLTLAAPPAAAQPATAPAPGLAVGAGIGGLLPLGPVGGARLVAELGHGHGLVLDVDLPRIDLDGPIGIYVVQYRWPGRVTPRQRTFVTFGGAGLWSPSPDARMSPPLIPVAGVANEYHVGRARLGTSVTVTVWPALAVRAGVSLTVPLGRR